MPTRRVALLLIAALLLVSGVVRWQWTVPQGENAVREPAISGVARIEHPAAVPAGRVVEFLRPAVPVAAVSSVPARELSADAAAHVAEMVALQLLAQDTDLELSARQWSVLAAVTAKIQEVRHAYEASIASAAVVAPGRYRMEIPAHAAAGDALRAQFHAGLREQLGDANAAEIIARLGARLEGHFAGFGVSVQRLDITGDVRGATGDWEVTRTVKFWNSVEGDERLTTRRETHFPGREDPAGDSWGPLLSVLNAHLAAPAGS